MLTKHPCPMSYAWSGNLAATARLILLGVHSECLVFTLDHCWPNSRATTSDRLHVQIEAAANNMRVRCAVLDTAHVGGAVRLFVVNISHVTAKTANAIPLV